MCNDHRLSINTLTKSTTTTTTRNFSCRKTIVKEERKEKLTTTTTTHHYYQSICLSTMMLSVKSTIIFSSVCLLLGAKSCRAAEAVISESGIPASIDLLCEDIAEEGMKQCQEWALAGECQKNKDFMEYKCRKSCGICNGGDGYDALECLDLADEGETQCREWAWQGECENNAFFMEHKCRKSCGLCTPKEEPVCKDAFPACGEWAGLGRCNGYWQAKKGPYTINSPFVVEFCPQSCGVCDIHLDNSDFELGMGFPQTAPDIDEPYMEHRLKAKISETRRYLLTLTPELREVCKFGHVNCARFALSENECEAQADHYVFKYLCAAACQTCEKFEDPEERAALEEHYKEALDEAQTYWEYHQEKKMMEEMEDEWY